MRDPGHFSKAFLFFEKNSKSFTRLCTRHRHLDISHIYMTYVKRYI